MQLSFFLLSTNKKTQIKYRFNPVKKLLLLSFYVTPCFLVASYQFYEGSCVGRDSSIIIVTCYGLDRPGIESGWGQASPQLSKPALEPSQPPIKWVPGLFRG
jgi:hypothetical protein